MRFPSVSDLAIMKPKKDGSTYFAAFAFQKKTQPLTIHLDGVTCVKSKSALYVKSKEFMNYMADMNDHIVETVKQKCASWFNSNMDTNLVDEYFVNPLRYDKEHGYLVKIGECDVDPGRYSLVLEARGLRFLKQKFNIEWVVADISPAHDIEFTIDDDTETESESEEDLPEPIPDDIREVKEHHQAQIDNLCDRHKATIASTQDVLHKLEALRNDIDGFATVADFLGVEDLLESLQ